MQNSSFALAILNLSTQALTCLGNEGAVLASHNHLAIHGNAGTGCYIKVPEGFVSALLQNSCQIIIIVQFQRGVLKRQSACELEPQHSTRGRKQLNPGEEISDTLSQKCTTSTQPAGVCI